MDKYDGHTKGWKIAKPSPSGAINIGNERGVMICQLPLQPNQDANAQLIADAPMILSQLNEALGMLKKHCKFCGMEFDNADTVRPCREGDCGTLDIITKIERANA